MTHRGWIGVDLDGTLAHYDIWRGEGHVGQPVPAMLERVKNWVAQGLEVKIFTARVSGGEEEKAYCTKIIHMWCQKHGLPALEVTNVKDFRMIQLWDDRAIQVVPNTGERADGRPDQ